MYRICALLTAIVMMFAIPVFSAQTPEDVQLQPDDTAGKLKAISDIQEEMRLRRELTVINMYDEYMAVLDDLAKVKTPEEIQTISQTELSANVHPRLFARQEKFDEIRKSIAEDQFMANLYRKLKEYADGLMAKAPIKRNDSELGGDELAFARECLDRSLVFGMLYRLDGEVKYRDFLYAQMEIAILDFMQWDAVKVLQTAEMTLAVSLTYDWLYDGLDSAQRDYLLNVIKRRLMMVEENYSASTSSYATQINNWNGVCNGAYGSASLAILYEEPLFASKMLHNATKHIRIAMSEMLPSGGFSEGPGYWTYQVQYISYLLSCLESTLGSDFGLGDMPSFSDTGLYPVYMHGPTYKAFNFADSGETVPVTVYNYWFSQKYSYLDGLQKIASEVNPSGTNYDSWEMKGTDSLIMIWYTKMQKDIFDGLPTGHCFLGKVPAASLRSEWENPLATFVAFKGGHGQASHGNLDMGSFVMDALGKRWVSDLGGEDYGSEGYWFFDEKGGRWEYFSQRAEGHNMFVINPSREPDQDVYEKADIVEFDNDKGYGIIDLSAVYKKNAISAKRGIALCGDSIVVRDEIQTKKSDDTVIWGINTRASIELGANGKYADLIQGNDRVRVYIIGENDHRFEIARAESTVYQRKEGEKTFPDVQRLVIKTYKGGNVEFSVQFSPYTKDEHPPQSYRSIRALSEWKNEGSIYEYKGLISEVFMDGKPLELFSANKMGYVVYLEDSHIPEVTAKYDGINVSLKQTDAQKIGDSTIIELNVKDPRLNNLRYSFKFRNKTVFGEPLDRQKFKPSQITLSGEGNIANPVEGLTDGRLDTRWAIDGECNAVFSFDEAIELDMITLAFYYGNQRQAMFDLAVSEDGVNYTTVFSGMSSGLTNSPEQYGFEKQKVKYVKFTGHGNSANTWNNVTEIGFWAQQNQ